MKSAEEYADLALTTIERAENSLDGPAERQRLVDAAGVYARLAEVATKADRRNRPITVQLDAVQLERLRVRRSPGGAW